MASEEISSEMNSQCEHQPASLRRQTEERCRFYPLSPVTHAMSLRHYYYYYYYYIIIVKVQ